MIPIDTHPDRESHAPDGEGGLLVALLVRFPQIARVRVSPEEAALELAFLLRELPPADETATFRRSLSSALSAFARLDGRAGPMERFVSVRAEGHEQLATVTVVRDVATLEAGEFALILGMVTDAFGERLIVDPEFDREPPFESDDEGVLSQSLEALRTAAVGRKLVGFRDEGRVFLFNEA